MASGYQAAISTAVTTAMQAMDQPPATPDTAEPTAPVPATTEEPAGQPPDTPPAAPAPDADSAAEELYSPEQLAALKGDELATAKRLQADYTRKTMALADERKQLAEAKALTDALRADPAAVIRQLAQQAGLAIADPAAAVPAPATDETMRKLEELFGEHAPVIADIVKALAKREAAAEAAPLQTALTQQQARAMAQEADATLAEFTAKHPNWRQHEAKMIAIGDQLEPKGMSTVDFMEICLREATKDIRAADSMTAAATALNNAAAKKDAPGSGMQPGKVTKNVTGPVSVRQAIEDAFAGVQYGKE